MLTAVAPELTAIAATPPSSAADALLEHVDGRVVDAVVVKAPGLEVHDRAGVIRVDELVRDRLIDRNRDGAGRVRGVAAVNGERFVAHRSVRRRAGAAHAAARRSTTSCARWGSCGPRQLQPVRVQRGRNGCPAVLDRRGHLLEREGWPQLARIHVCRAGRDARTSSRSPPPPRRDSRRADEDTGRRPGRTGSGVRRGGTRAAGSACRTPDGPGRGRTARLPALAPPPTSRRPSAGPTTMR